MLVKWSHTLLDEKNILQFSRGVRPFRFVFRSISSYRIFSCMASSRNLRPPKICRTTNGQAGPWTIPPAERPGETRLQNQSGLLSGFLAFNPMSIGCLYLESVIPSSTSIGSPSSWSSWNPVRAAVPNGLTLRVQQEPLHKIFRKSCPMNFFENRVWGNFSKIVVTRNFKIPNGIPSVWFPLSLVRMCRMWNQLCRLVAAVSGYGSIHWCLQISEHEFFRKSCLTWLEVSSMPGDPAWSSPIGVPICSVGVYSNSGINWHSCVSSKIQERLLVWSQISVQRPEALIIIHWIFGPVDWDVSSLVRVISGSIVHVCVHMPI